MDSNKSLPVITKSRLIKDLQQLGVEPGQTVMLHASVKAIGWVVGGPDIVLQALLDVLTSKGTLIMLAGWEDCAYDLSEWPKEKQEAYLEECPPFDPTTSRANREWSILNEYLRTRPGAYRSNHPKGSFVALGDNARWITENHPLQYGYCSGSPLEKLHNSGGKILMLGAPLDNVTALHYAEYLAKVPNKRVVNYRMPVMYEGTRAWIDIEEYDTSLRIVDWQGENYFAIIGREYLKSGKGNSGKVGGAQSHLFDVKDLVGFGVKWMERSFNK